MLLLSVSKFTSVNVGAPNTAASPKSSGVSMSKSDGSGKSVNCSSFDVSELVFVASFCSCIPLAYAVFTASVPN